MSDPVEAEKQKNTPRPLAFTKMDKGKRTKVKIFIFTCVKDGLLL